MNDAENEIIDAVIESSDEDVLPRALRNEEHHDDVLSYLKELLATDRTNLNARRSRYQKIDKEMATWRAKSKEDSEKEAQAVKTGNPTLVKFNLPVVYTYVEDMVAFYTNVFAPTDGSFFSIPSHKVGDEGALQGLTRKLNADARLGEYFSHLTAFARSQVSYNIGGFHLRWDESNGSKAGGRNVIEAIDMHNFSWDPAIQYTPKLVEEGVWAAQFRVETIVVLNRKERDQTYQGIARVLEEKAGAEAFKYYSEVDSHLERHEVAGGDDLDSFFTSAGYTSMNLGEMSAIEVVDMYCWVPASLINGQESAQDVIGTKSALTLYKIVIANGKHIIQMDEVVNGRIPLFLGRLNEQGHGVDQKSAAEFVQPFQQFSSFLLNIYGSATRSNVFGITAYDPTMFDLDQVEPGEVTARVQSKIPGRDVRSGINRVSDKVDTGELIPAIGQLMAIMQQLFPAQSLPSQVAGIDRAVKNQVAAVMQGVNKRLHMNVRNLDSTVMSNLYMECFRNLQEFGADSLGERTEEDVVTLLGTGLMQLNKEAAEDAMRQLIFALIQNPQSAEKFDLNALIKHWATLLDLDIELGSAEKGQESDQTPGQDPADLQLAQAAQAAE